MCEMPKIWEGHRHPVSIKNYILCLSHRHHGSVAYGIRKTNINTTHRLT